MTKRGRDSLKTKLNGLLATSILLMSSVSWGWGAVGHRTTALVAEAWLTPQARQDVNHLLQGARLVDVVNWADSLRSGSGMGHVSWYHFEKMDDGVNFLNHLQQMPASQRQKGGVMEAILYAQSQLENPQVSAADKGVALKMLIHFIGDLHQPLHTGRIQDKGGLKVPVTWFGQSISLHKLWDSAMILSGHWDEIFARLPANADYAGPYAQWLSQRYRGYTLPANSRWNTEAWLAESLNMRPGTYNLTDETSYQNTHLQDMDIRIYAAGLRIADVLNRIFAGQRSSPDVNLYRRIEQVVGKIENIISFRPRNFEGEAFGHE